jgi:N-methylhydantoinase B
MDGWDAIGWVNAGGACHHGETELMEYREPIRIWRHELRTDSACAGKWRGGLGTVHEVEVLAPVSVTTIADGVRYPSASRSGARSPLLEQKVHAKWLIQGDRVEPVVPQTVVSVPAGTRVLSHSAGGGGVGDPLERDRDAVAEDVRDGLVSVRGAREEYGVVIDPEAL